MVYAQPEVITFTYECTRTLVCLQRRSAVSTKAAIKVKERGDSINALDEASVLELLLAVLVLDEEPDKDEEVELTVPFNRSALRYNTTIMLERSFIRCYTRCYLNR